MNEVFKGPVSIKLYEDDWSFTCGMNMKVHNGQVTICEHNNETYDPDCYRRILTVGLKPLLSALQITDESFVSEMRKRFGCVDGSLFLHEFLCKSDIGHGFQDFYNMFIGWEHLSIRHHVQLNISAEEFNKSILNWYGYSLSSRSERQLIYSCKLPVFGPCHIYVDIPSNLPVGQVRIMTNQKVNEQDMFPMLEYMKKSMPIKPYYDDHGYRGLPKPHEIDLVWELTQGNVGMSWDGFNYTRSEGGCYPRGDGSDFVSITLWDKCHIQRLRDEEYWRSEVD